MDVDFVVHSVAKAQANVRTEVDGEPMTAQVPCLEVELTTVQERSGTLTLRLVGSAMAAAEGLFKPDAQISASFAAKNGKAEAEPVPPPAPVVEEAPAPKAKTKG
jgi:hypothetical protein